jgi:prepilin-type processing-associated H-X9-DG protein
MNNTHQLTLAWKMYADDSTGNFPPNQPGTDPTVGWVRGWMDFTPNHTDNTNLLWLTDPHFARLGPYTRSPGIYKCPADLSMAKEGGATLPRVRSISMSQAIGPNQAGNDSGQGYWLPHDTAPYYRVFIKDADTATHLGGPANLWVFVDEHPDSINDAALGNRGPQPPNQTQMVDWPASFHNGACGFAFVDGHSEIHKWRDSRTTAPVKYNDWLYNLVAPISQPNNQDLIWLAQRSSTPK